MVVACCNQSNPASEPDSVFSVCSFASLGSGAALPSMEAAIQSGTADETFS